jgi:7,8-dihydropterin-6-yl-methyl-4-(beta-D-ribofuranosyl)aminobenzene 5'-phosphate synthase
MPSIPNFGLAEHVDVTVLMDNRADLIVKSSRTVKYWTKGPLLAEHGFSALIDLKEGGERILWDAGLTPEALPENMRRLGIDAKSIGRLAISHGHHDHTAAVSAVVRAMDLGPKPREWAAGTPVQEMRTWAAGRRVPLVAHPAAFRERWGVGKDGKKHGPLGGPPRAEWEALGAEIVLSEGPFRLGAGCWTTGLVPRLTFEKSGRPASLAYRDGDAFFQDDLEEDQAIVIHVRDKGLVVVSGCAHSGIVNTVNHARAISGVDDIYAILGGFHLARASDEEIQSTVEAVQAFQPRLIVPSHCTGFKAMCAFAAAMPDAFLPGVVGAKYRF